MPLRVELDDAVALGIGHDIAEHRRAAFARGGARQQVREAVAVEDVVAEDERDALGPTKSRPMMNASASPRGCSCTA